MDSVYYEQILDEKDLEIERLEDAVRDCQAEIRRLREVIRTQEELRPRHTKERDER